MMPTLTIVSGETPSTTVSTPLVEAARGTRPFKAEVWADSGFIVPITDTTTGKIVVATDATWKGLVTHAAPLNPDCEKSLIPEKTCMSRIAEEPIGWGAFQSCSTRSSPGDGKR